MNTLEIIRRKEEKDKRQSLAKLAYIKMSSAKR
jgi:hypothetical protein